MDTEIAVPAGVLDAFDAAGAVIEPLSGGRTNRTMRLRAGRDLVLQQLRAGSHADLLGVMENLVRVTSHLEWKQATDRTHDVASWWPRLVPTADRRPFLMTDGGDVWRAFVYRPGRIARAVQPLEVLESAASLFGRFSEATLDLDGPPLEVTTPGFHDLATVWHDFEAELDDAAGDPTRRAAVETLRSDLAAIEESRRVVEHRCAADGLGSVRSRVVHNDTKVSNVLLDEREPVAIAVLDLDLVMMGPLWHDVGDLIRSVAWHTTGQPPDADPAVAARVLAAFTEAASDGVDAAEIATFAAAGPRLSFELGVRYLTDHLRTEPRLRVGGVEGHRRRGLANLNLATEMLKAYDALRSSVDELIARR